MNDDVLKIFDLLIKLITPLVILILGLQINRELEKNRTFLAKEKDWQNWWAEKMLNIACIYNNTVSIIVCDMFALGQPGHDEKFTELTRQEINGNIIKLQYCDWEIQNYLDFAPKNGKNLDEKRRLLFALLKDLIANGGGDLEKIRTAQYLFNQELSLVHREILNIKVKN